MERTRPCTGRRVREQVSGVYRSNHLETNFIHIKIFQLGPPIQGQQTVFFFIDKDKQFFNIEFGYCENLIVYMIENLFKAYYLLGRL